MTPGGFGVLRSRPFHISVIQMDVEEQIVQSTMAAWKAEIERAIINAKRTEWDKWWRGQFYRETGRMAKQRWQKRAWRGRRPRPIRFNIENNS